MREIPIDVLLASYNGERYIEEQVKSIMDQTYSNIRLIVRDDASSDTTKEILDNLQKKYHNKMRVVSGERKGVIGNFWELLKLSDAPYTMFSDQDDVWDKKKVEWTFAAMQKGESESPKTPHLVHTDLSVVDENLQCLATSYWRFAALFPEKGATFKRLLVQNVVTGSTVMINQPLKNLLPFKTPSTVMHDWWFALTAAAFGKITSLNRSTLLYRQHPANVLGAQEFSLLTRALHHFKDSDRTAKKFIQAKAFFDTYMAELPQDRKEELQIFLNAPHVGFFKRKYHFFRHQFFWNGFLRNAAKFLLNYPY